MMDKHASARSFVDVLRRQADERGDAEAVSFPSGWPTLSYSALDRRARAIAVRLREALSPGERALIAAPTGPAYVTAFFGCLYAGVIAVTGYPPRRRREDPRLAVIVGSALPRVILGPREVLAEIEDGSPIGSLPRIDVEAVGDEHAAAWTPPVDPGRVALLQYTSGSTTLPRGVRVTHANLLYNSALCHRRDGLSERDRTVSWLPLFHDMGLVGALLYPIYWGASTALLRPADFLQRPLCWLAAISRLQATMTVAPDWGYAMCVRQISAEDRALLDLGSLRACWNGAEPIRARTLEAFARAFGPCGFRREAFLPCYGLAEATLLVSGGGPHRGRIHQVDSIALTRGEVRPAVDGASASLLVSCGEFEDGNHVAIVDPETGRRARHGTIGEIWIAGPSVTDGYWNSPEETTAVFGARIAESDDGPFLRTGDLGFVVDGELVVTGRLKDVIILRGANHYPQDVEAAVETAHPAIASRGVMAFGAEIHGEERCVVVAELVRRCAPSSELELEEIVASVRGAVTEATEITVAAIALLRPLSLPKTSSGKLRRKDCKEAWIEGRLDCAKSWIESPPEPRWSPSPLDARPGRAPAEMLALLLRTAAELLRLPSAANVRPEQSLRRVGLDSLGLVDLKRRLEGALGVDIPLGALDDDPSFATLAERIAALGAAREAGASGSTARVVAVSHFAPPATPLLAPARASSIGMSLMFFSSNEAEIERGKYDHVIEAARLADRGGLEAVWLPERHFHPFGGLFPDPAVLAAALAMRTERIRLRAGSVVLPLHDPIEVLERWAMVDNLSNGRVDVALASGWDADSYCLAPEAYSERVVRTLAGARELRRLWRGDPSIRRNGEGREVELRPLPRPLQRELACWLTVAQRADRIGAAGENGFHVLTALLFQPLEALAEKIRRYRDARRHVGLDPSAGRVTLMLHTYLGADPEEVRETVRPPFLEYLRSSIDLWGRESASLGGLDTARREEVVHLAFERYFCTAGLFGTPEDCAERVRAIQAAGVDEIACLVDFGVPRSRLLAGVEQIGELRRALDRPERSTGEALSVPTLSAAPAAPVPAKTPLVLDLDARHRIASQPVSDVFARARSFTLSRQLRETDLMAFFNEFGERRGAFIEYQGRYILQLGSLDYLGLTMDERVRSAAAEAALKEGTSRTGSRAHNGSTAQQRRFERRLADFVGREDALVFATGYQAQLGLISGLVDPDSVLVLDELAHASLYDGALLARCNILRFAHNDPEDLDRVLSRLRQGTAAMVVAEGMYSNEGDIPSLAQLVEVCRRRGARLALDEAHSLGVLGARGKGCEEEVGLPLTADVLSGTLSKSLASIGGWIAGPADVIDWIRFNARSFLFSAAISPASLAAGDTALEILATEPERVVDLRRLAERWRAALRACSLTTNSSPGPIVPIYLDDEVACLKAARVLLERGIYVNAVIAPSAPRGRALLRTCVTALHKPDDLEWAAGVIAEVVTSASASSSGSSARNQRELTSRPS
jgi:natural product biosynthesis luciferase-like monooxygenase protein